MSRTFLLLLLAHWVLDPLAAAAVESGHAPRNSVLLLRNGGVLEGQVIPAGDRYVVVLGDCAEIRVPVRDVDLHCVDLDEVYLRKRSRLASNDVTGHLDLADWCLQYKLHARAADQLLTVIALHPQHPRLAGLERRLQLAVESPELDGPQERAPSPLVGLADLEKTSRSLPPEAVEEFTSQIQPLLLNRCAGSDCHSSTGSSDFRLVRPAWSNTITRRFTQRNLHAVMQWVDAEDAASSPLLTVPSGAHGGLETGLFGPREKEQFDLLANWVRRATTVESAPVPEMIPEPLEIPPTGLIQASFLQPVELPKPRAEDAGAGAAPRVERPPLEAQPRSLVPVDFVPRDPFDAEVFNRRYHADR
jgi:predicted CxxxxCH...CXXCH cytochrome family protein